MRNHFAKHPVKKKLKGEEEEEKTHKGTAVMDYFLTLLSASIIISVGFYLKLS